MLTSVDNVVQTNSQILMMTLVLFDPVGDVGYQMCLLWDLVLCLVDHCLHLIQYKAVITVGVFIFIYFRFTIIFHFLSCDLICTVFGVQFLFGKVKTCKMSIFLTCLALIFLCWAGEPLCMLSITTFQTVIWDAMSLRLIEQSLWWWFAILVFEMLLAFVSFLLLVH